MTLSTSVPPTRREDVVDNYHGIAVPDPYRWLEDGDDADVVAWVATQNELTSSFLAVPARAEWHRRLLDVMELPVLQHAVLRGDHLFCYERPAGAEQFVLTRRSAIDSAEPPVVLLDPATFSEDAATAIDWYYPSRDGSLVAVGISEGGTEQSVLHVLSGADGSTAGGVGDRIPDTRASSVAWEPDGTGFFYVRYPAGDEYNRTVHHHRLGTDWRDDPVVWDDRPDPQAWPDVMLTDDGRWLIVSVEVGYRRTDIHALDRHADRWSTTIADVDATTQFSIAADDRSLVGISNLDAPRGRVVRVVLDGEVLDRGPEAWDTVVAERNEVIAQLAVTRRGLLMVTSSGAVDTVHRLDADGRPGEPVEGLENSISVADGGLAADSGVDEAFVVVDTYVAPTGLWKIPASGAATSATPLSDAERLTAGLVVERTSYRSPDGTEIGLFLIHRADVTPSADTPTILNGYGGFTITMSPGWQPRIAAWCAAGGLYAVAGLRGGLEHGEEWHIAGSRDNKQNVFDDFHAAADHLVDAGLTSRSRLAILGGSNGGLLVGVAVTQRPDLCRAVLCAVPLLDMVRFPRFLIAKLWTSEYGDPDVAEEFAWLHAYSPYHHVVDGTCYPATLVQTAEGDTRVDPLHARKMVARLQAASACLDENPILLSQEGRAGHGVGKPVSKRADEIADALTFLGHHVGLQL
ncbi:MAG TPA: prolyl oligopeptidase family serine peptidase [Desertimonas sp.]|nr:prolyl oligopeptidase family serine peptidase [Desertimonas sp.]